MLTTIYLDVLFLLDAVIDGCMLSATGKLSDIGTRWYRLLLGAVCGGLYGVAAALYANVWVAAACIQIVASFCMVLITFGFGSVARLVRLWAVFFCVNFVFGGCVLAVSLMTREDFFAISIGTLVASILLCYAGMSLVLRKIARKRTKLSEIFVEFSGRACRFRAFVDTGMGIKDPVNHAPVILTEAGAIRPLFSEYTYKAFCRGEPTHTLETRFRFIPYRTVGSEKKLLPAFRPDSVLVDGKKIAQALIAVSPTKLNEYGEYEALIGEMETRGKDAVR